MTVTVLRDICKYRNESAPIDSTFYVSTESMLPDKGGTTVATSVPATGKARRFKRGDTLISNIRPYFKKVWQATTNGYCSADVLVFEPTNCNADYLYWLLSSDSFFDYVVATSKGTKMPRGDKDAIMTYEFVGIDLDDQFKISNILNPVREKIASNNRLNDYLAALLDIQFEQILAEADEDWERGSLLDIASYKNGLAMQKFRPEGNDKGLPVLKIRELGQGYCGKDTERCRSDIDESVVIRDGDLVFSWSGTLLLDFWAAGDAGLNQHLFKVTSKDYPSWFYYMWTKRHLRRFIAMAKDRATTMGHIKRSALQESEVLIPPSDTLTELTTIMQPMVDEIIGLKVQGRKLGKLRDALLPKLMSGEIDVSRVDLTQLNNHLFSCKGKT